MLAIDCDARFLERVVQGYICHQMLLHDFFELFIVFLPPFLVLARDYPNHLLGCDRYCPAIPKLLPNTFSSVRRPASPERVNDQTPTFSEQYPRRCVRRVREATVRAAWRSP